MIAPVGVSVDVKASCRHSTVVFSSIAEFERWRAAGEVHRRPTIASYVQEALTLAGIKTDSIRPAIDWLRHRASVPTVKELAAAWSSRRSFFRAWKADAPITPREFLHFVRCLQAEDLLHRGMHEREVVKATGFRNVAEMRTALRRRARAPRRDT